MIYINAEGKKLVDSLEIGKEEEIIVNPYSKRSCKCTPIAVALYDFIKGSERIGKTDAQFELALMIFRLNFPDEYDILVD